MPAPAEMQNQLVAALGTGITVENSGVPGSYLRENLDGGNAHYATPFKTRIASDPSKIVIESSAINDWPVRTAEQYTADLNEWISTVRAAGKTPVLEEPNPTCWSQLDAFVGIMRNVAQQQNVLLIQQYDYIKSIPNWTSMVPDCLHPTQALYTIIGDREANQIKSLVQSLR